MAYEVIILGHLHMPLYFLGTFTEYRKKNGTKNESSFMPLYIEKYLIR